MVRMLVEKGAEVQAADKRGYTALMRAALPYEPGACTGCGISAETGRPHRSEERNGGYGAFLCSSLRRYTCCWYAAPRWRARGKDGDPGSSTLAENSVRDALPGVCPCSSTSVNRYTRCDTALRATTIPCPRSLSRWPARVDSRWMPLWRARNTTVRLRQHRA